MTDPQGFSRRKFLKGVGVSALAAGALQGAVPGQTKKDEKAAKEAKAVGPGPVPIELEINGERHQLEVEPRVTLIDALRNQLGITGAKKVCDRGVCGACSVLLDGRAAYACSILAISAQGRKIETVEGLSKQGRLSKLQQAFVRHDGAQCGFCTPGFVVASESLLRRRSRPSREEVLEGLGGNLCRCGTYKGVTQAVLEAGGEDQ